MAKRVDALVEPTMLVWARRTSGYTIEEVARKARVDVERILSWENGDTRPTIDQLRKLAQIFKRPLAAFYLPEPPKDFTIPHDFRRLPEPEKDRISPRLLFEIRQAEYRRDVALQLYFDLGEDPPQFEISANLDKTPEQLARELRAYLNVSYETQIQWRDSHQALNQWRSALEQLGVLVFQVPGIEIEEMRGFSIGERPLPVVAVNTKDAVHGRIFSMLHEFVHIVLGENGLCNWMEGWLDPPIEQRVEVFCNRVAGAILVPEERILREPEVIANRHEVIWSEDDLIALSRRYNVSREVILRRILLLGRTTEEFYQQKRAQYQDEWRRQKDSQKRSRPVPRDRIAVTRSGKLFAQLVISGYYSDKITGSDVTRFLDVALKHIPAMRDNIFGLT